MDRNPYRKSFPRKNHNPYHSLCFMYGGSKIIFIYPNKCSFLPLGSQHPGGPTFSPNHNRPDLADSRQVCLLVFKHDDVGLN